MAPGKSDLPSTSSAATSTESIGRDKKENCLQAEPNVFVEDVAPKLQSASDSSSPTSSKDAVPASMEDVVPDILFDPPELFMDVDNQSRILDPVEGIRTSHKGVNGEDIPPRFYPEVQTCWDAFLRGRSKSTDGKCYGVYSEEVDDWVYTSYDEMYEKVRHVGSALVTLGMPQDTTSAVGIYAKNCLEWNILEYTCYANSMMATPLYDTFGQEAVVNIINETEMVFLFCDDDAKLETLLAHKQELPRLKIVVTKFDATPEQRSAVLQHEGLQMYSFKELETMGAASPHDMKPANKDDVAVLMYTSGTTGMPKGAFLTHDNITFTIQMFLYQIHKGPHGACRITHDDTILTMLPKAHMSPMCTELHLISAGGKIALFRGDVKKILEDLHRVKPTIVIMVPVLLNRIYNKIMVAVEASWVKKKIFDYAVAHKLSWYSQGHISNNTWYDYFLFSKVQNLLGGRMKILVTGSAPIDRKVLAFARGVFGCLVIECYGQTEASGANIVTLPTDCGVQGHIGAPLPNMEIKLVDVPEMDYYQAENRGEVCIRGRCNFKGYLKRPTVTAETIDKDGWIHTGDVGEWMPNGALKIIDRKKNMFKLLQAGIHVAPEKVEQIYILSPWVDQVLVEGKSTETYAVGITVLNKEYTEAWAKNNKVAGTFEELLQVEDVKKAFLEHLQNFGKEKGLNGFEQVKRVLLLAEPFSIENGLLTPTMKLKRVALRKFFKGSVEDLYCEED